MQFFSGECHLQGFISHTLSAAECWYSVFDREVLATYAAIQHFQSAIKGCRCCLCTNHWPLALISDPRSSWQQRHLSVLAGFLADVLYLPNSRNVATDALSSASVSSTSLGVDYETLISLRSSLTMSVHTAQPSPLSTCVTFSSLQHLPLSCVMSPLAHPNRWFLLLCITRVLTCYIPFPTMVFGQAST